MFALFSTVAIAQEANQAAPEISAAEKANIIKEFARSAEMDGVTFNYVLLTNKTIDILFPGDAKYSMRARANAATMFFIQGVPGKKLGQFNPKYEIEQNGRTFDGESVNISNFQAGTVEKGSKIAGLIQLTQKIDVTRPFKIKCASGSIEFRLSSNAIKLLQN